MKPLQIIGALFPVPNPWKVVIILEELGLPYQHVKLLSGAPDRAAFLKAVKSAPFIDINPNGRVPALIDPNKDNLMVWESGAIVEYLIEQYDTSHKLSSPPSDLRTKYLERSLLAFQISGQGPYFGEAVHFSNYHEKHLPTAIKRFVDEGERVVSVLDRILRQSEGPWLTGDKLSYVDLCFVSWFFVTTKAFDDARKADGKVGFHQELMEKYPAWTKWNDAVLQRPSVKTVQDAHISGDYSRFGEKTMADLAKEMGIAESESA